MSDEQWLHDRLAAAVPDAPPTPDRAAGARDRRRRSVRRATALAAAATAVVAILGVALPVARSHSIGGPSPTTAPASEGCPPKSAEPVHLSGASTLPPGAVWISLCPRTGLFSATLPEGALTDDAVGRLVTEVNAQPVQPSDEACPSTSTGDVDYSLLVGYPDGSARQVVGEWDYGCLSLYVGATRRDGGAQVLNDFLTALTAQRAAQVPPATPPRPASCAVLHGAPFLAGPQGTRQAVLCVGYSTDDRSHRHSSGLPTAVPIPSADLRTLLDDWSSRRSGPHQPMPTKDCPGSAPWTDQPNELNWTIDGVTAWGDDTQVESGPFGEWMDGSGNSAWLLGCPSAASERILNGLIAQVPKPPAS